MQRQSISKLCIYLLCFIIFQSNFLQASTYGPGLLFHKPYSTEPYHTCFYMSFAEGNTTQAYNEAGGIVPYLQEYGQEDLLKRFIDPTLPKDNVETLGTIDLSGVFSFEQLNISLSKNIHHNLFIGVSTSIRNLSINSIGIDIELTKGVVLTQEQLFRLDLFESKIPTTVNKSGIFGTEIDLGYNKIWDEFKAIDFLHFFIKGGISFPQWMTGHNVAALQYPIAGNITFSYPITAIFAVGLLKHVNFGIYGLMIPLQPRQLSLPVNRTESNNQIILTESTRVQINPKPLFSTVLYMELHDLLPKCMGTIGYGYAYGMAWSITSLNEREFPSEKINRTKILAPWNISSMFFQLDYCFASETNHHAPNLSFFYVIPIAGILYPKMNVVGGAYNFNFCCEF
jgi:hypothetical protein